VATGILPELREDDLLEHQRRIREVIARYREWCLEHEIPWVPVSEAKPG
jgi:hypothetical protein